MSKEQVYFGDARNWKALYTPAVVVGPGRTMYISGQVALDDKGKVIGVGDIEAQARICFNNIRALLRAAGGDFSNIIKTNYYVTDARQFPKVGAMRPEIFGDSYPASTMVEVSGLVHDDLLIEIEAVAYFPDQE
ncbi:MAG: RidA family protein [Thermodesulfobacteriota bacterium]